MREFDIRMAREYARCLTPECSFRWASDKNGRFSRDKYESFLAGHEYALQKVADTFKRFHMQSAQSGCEIPRGLFEAIRELAAAPGGSDGVGSGNKTEAV